MGHIGSVEVWARRRSVVVSFQPGTTAVLEVDTAREFLRALTRAVDEAVDGAADEPLVHDDVASPAGDRDAVGYT